MEITVTKRILQTVYKLKRIYGREITLYRQGTLQTNTLTGVKSWTDRSAIDVKRCIVLPVKLSRGQIQTISMISANKQFVEGGMFDTASRWFYIDPRDLPANYEIKRDDFLIYGNKKYEFKDIKYNEFDLLWEVLGVELVGEDIQQVFNLSGYDIVNFQQVNEEGD